MYRQLVFAFAMLWLGSIAVVQTAADDKTEAATDATADESAEEQFAAIQAEYNAAMEEFRVAYSKAAQDATKLEDPAEARKAMQAVYQEKYPNPVDFSARFLKLAEENIDDPIAITALGWVIQRARGSRESDVAIGLLAEHHMESDQLRPIVMSLTRAQPSENTEAFLRAVAAQNPDGDTNGMAKYALAKYVANLASVRAALEQSDERAAMYKRMLGEAMVANLMDRAAKDFEVEAETLFEDIAANHGEVSFGRRTLADVVEGELFEIKYLGIGKVAPDIEGEDLDGVSFKLSDYRGKVVVLDFWGDW